MKKAKNLAVAAAALFLVPALFSACNLFGVHKHKMTYVPALQPTCENTGMCEYWHCESCGENFGDEAGTVKSGNTPVKELGHSMIGDIIVEEPTCTEGGLRRMKCSREGCDYVSYKSINSLGHDFGEWEITSPTCIKDGTKLRTCNREDCDEVERESIAATGNHKWADGEITQATTCTATGARTIKCLTCNQTKSVEIPATGHSYETVVTTVSASCTTEGEDELTCATCNHVETVTTPKTAHDFSSNNGCKYCSTKLTASLNLGYQKNYGESSYSITSSKFVIDADVVIPAYHGNLPVVEIKDSAFAEKKTMQSVFIPDTVTKIGSDAFLSCSKLTKVVMGKNVKEIAVRAFNLCPLTEVHVDDLAAWCNIDGTNGLLNTAKLYVRGREVTDLVIPDGVTSLKYGAFKGASITSLHIGKDVTSINYGAFQNCKNLSRITVDSRNTAFRAENNCLIEIATNTVILGCKNSFIPKNIAAIGDYAFYCAELECVTIPNSVTTIMPSAFSGCNLTSVNFENPTGWKCTRYTTSFDLNEEELTDPLNAATLLSKTNTSYTWVVQQD